MSDGRGFTTSAAAVAAVVMGVLATIVLLGGSVDFADPPEPPAGQLERNGVLGASDPLPATLRELQALLAAPGGPAEAVRRRADALRAANRRELASRAAGREGGSASTGRGGPARRLAAGPGSLISTPDPRRRGRLRPAQAPTGTAPQAGGTPSPSKGRTGGRAGSQTGRQGGEDGGGRRGDEDDDDDDNRRRSGGRGGGDDDDDDRARSSGQRGDARPGRSTRRAGGAAKGQRGGRARTRRGGRAGGQRKGRGRGDRKRRGQGHRKRR